MAEKRLTPGAGSKQRLSACSYSSEHSKGGLLHLVR
jgi:hypothetical protein